MLEVGGALPWFELLFVASVVGEDDEAPDNGDPAGLVRVVPSSGWVPASIVERAPRALVELAVDAQLIDSAMRVKRERPCCRVTRSRRDYLGLAADARSQHYQGQGAQCRGPEANAR